MAGLYEGVHQIMAEDYKAFQKKQLIAGMCAEWQFLSRVVDRALFLSFVFATLFVNVIILTMWVEVKLFRKGFMIDVTNFLKSHGMD